jgi:cellulose synthase/poly-beta-1,6-N-acetylglucosamine synthase-like glycosyltransferase
MDQGVAIACTVAIAIIVLFVLYLPFAVICTTLGRCAARLRQRCSSTRFVAIHETKPSISVIVPAYLPNEHVVLEYTIEHILTKLHWPGNLQLIVVYNTDSEMDFEHRLLELQEMWSRGVANRTLRVLPVNGSHSKAENLNAAVSVAEHDCLCVYDADNIPEPDSLMYLYSSMIAKSVDVVQGCTYKMGFDRRSCVQLMEVLRRFIESQILQPGILFFTPMVLTGQANVLMKRAVPLKVPFDPAFLIEDVDWCLRVQAQKYKVAYCCHSQVGEQTATSLRAMHKVCRRYFVGLEQVYRAIANGRYAPSFFPWLFMWPGLRISLLVNFVMWPAVLFYHLAKPVGSNMPQRMGTVADGLLFASMYGNISVVLFLIVLIEVLTLRPAFWSRYDCVSVVVFFIVAFPVLVCAFGAMNICYVVYGFVLVQTGTIVNFDCSQRQNIAIPSVGAREGERDAHHAYPAVIGRSDDVIAEAV